VKRRRKELRPVLCDKRASSLSIAVFKFAFSKASVSREWSMSRRRRRLGEEN